MLSESRRSVKADERRMIAVAPELTGRKRLVSRTRPRMLRECKGLVRARRVARNVQFEWYRGYVYLLVSLIYY